MLNSVLLTLIVLLLVYISMAIRVHRIKYYRARNKSHEEISSPLGQAIKDFVAVAGGVYLGLMALAKFLKVPAPIQTQLWGVTFDPMAAVAVVLALIAPLLPIRENPW